MDVLVLHTVQSQCSWEAIANLNKQAYIKNPCLLNLTGNQTEKQGGRYPLIKENL